MENKINQKIKELKENILLVTQGYPYTEKEINLLTIASLSMILLDDEIEDLLLETLKETFVVFTSIDIKTVYHKLFPEQKEWRSLKANTAMYFGYFLYKGKLRQDHIIIVPQYQDTFLLLDNLIHELKHAINEVFPEFSTYQGQPIFYSGLAQCSEEEICYEGIDEAFNSFLTRIYLENINYLKTFKINDQEIKLILDHFTMPSNYQYAYEKIVLPCLPLFKSQLIFKELYYASLYKTFYNLDRVLSKTLNNINSLQFFLYLDKQLKRPNEGEELNYLNNNSLHKRVRIKPYLK